MASCTTDALQHTAGGHGPAMILKTAVNSVGERQGVVSVTLCTAPHLTKMVKSSMFAALFGFESDGHSDLISTAVFRMIPDHDQGAQGKRISKHLQ